MKRDIHNFEQDEVLLKKMAAGDEAAFSDFFHRRSQGIYTIILKLVKEKEVAKDLLQDVFVKAWLHRAELAGMDKPASWLMTIGTNLSINYLRRRQIEGRWLEEVKQTGSTQKADTEDQLVARQVRQLIHEAVQALPAQRKKIYMLSRERGLTRKGIAEELNLSEHTVRNQLAAALKSIYDHLVKQGVIFLAIFMDW